ncbi:MAG: transcription antitermination factor NusB [Oscillospiraceae bacterium]|nr:transcription antitermination factor NusB [Oscillospiraceae bacterium]MDE5852636.1 transcription antitermination factor NusB [Oscillospiraceae bacterium]
MKRCKARERAFILVFESLFSDTNINSLIELAENVEDVNLNGYAKSLAIGVVSKRAEIDEKIKLFLRKWKIDRIASVSLAILEIAFYEILYVDDVDSPVAINEAVELAKKYAGDDEPAFVNGVLGNFIRSNNK